MRVVETLARHQAVDNTVRVLAPTFPPRVEESPSLTWLDWGVRGNLDLSGHRRLWRTLKVFAPDVVLLHAASPGDCALAAALCARRWPTVVVEHLPEYYPLASRFRDPLFARAKRRAAAWVAVSDAGARGLERSWSLPTGTIGTFHPGIDAPPGIDGVETEGAEDRRDLVLALGRPIATKGFDTFVAIANALAGSWPAIRWVWVGAEEARQQGAVTVLAWVADAAPLLRQARLVLVPSRAEGLPLVLLEALALGRSVVASRVGGIPEAISNGVDGLVLDPEDRDGWIAAVARLLHDVELTRSIARAGHQTWASRFTGDAMAARCSALIEGAVRAFGR